jgi:hypothetical protein
VCEGRLQATEVAIGDGRRLPVLTRSIRMKEIRSKALEIAADLLEPALDVFIHNELLRENPFLGLAIKIAQTSRSVTDRIFLTKIARFLENLDAVSPEQAQTFASDLKADPELAERTGQVLLLSLDSMNDLEKAPILAVVFGAYVRREISLDIFRRLSAAIGLAMVEDVWELSKEDDPHGGQQSRHRRMLAVHALRITGLTALSDSAFAFVGKSSYIATAITPLGDVLIGILRASKDFQDRSSSSSL